MGKHQERTKTDISPSIEYNLIKGCFRISGTSIPENPVTVFEPFLKEVQKYSQAPAEMTTVVFNLEYINTSSLKWVFYILQIFEKLYIDKHKVDVKYYYEDISTEQIGNFLSMNLAIPIELIKK